MSKGAWKHRDPDTGLPASRFRLIDEAYLSDEDPPRLRLGLFLDCDRWNVSSLAAEVTGLRRPDRTVAAATADPAYPWRIILDVDGRVAARVTHVNSFAAWVNSYHAAIVDRRGDNLRHSSTGMDIPVGAGSVVQPVAVACTIDEDPDVGTWQRSYRCE